MMKNLLTNAKNAINNAKDEFTKNYTPDCRGCYEKAKAETEANIMAGVYAPSYLAGMATETVSRNAKKVADKVNGNKFVQDVKTSAVAGFNDGRVMSTLHYEQKLAEEERLEAAINEIMSCSYKNLQAKAKELGIKANMAADDLREAIIEML